MSSVHIIGAGVAGYTLAAQLVRQDYSGTITISDAQGLPYDRPPLSKGLQVQPFAPVAWYQEHRINLIQEEIAELTVPDSEDDWVVLATGTTPRQLGIPGAHYARTLHSAADAVFLDSELEAGMFGQRVLIIGAGLVGSEFASTAKMLGAQVTLVSNSDAPMAPVLGEDLAAQLHAEHGVHGITTITGAVTELGPNYAMVDGRRIDAEIIVAAIGVDPQTALAERAGLEVEDGIVVHADQRSVSHRQVLAIGDAARHAGARRAVHWEAAMEDAAIAAATILGTEAPERTVDWFWSDRHEAHVESVGDFSAVHSTVKRYNSRGKIQAVFGLDANGALVAASMVDGGLMAKAVKRLIAQGRTPEISQLEDPGVTPRELERPST